MQIPKSLIIFCAAIAVALPISVFADTDAQSKAREALEKKMKELGSQTASAPAAKVEPTPKPAKPAQPAPAPKPAKKAPVPAPPVPQSVQAEPAPLASPPPAADSEAIRKAREAMREKMDELEAPKTAPTKAPEVVQPKPVQPAPPVVSKPAAPVAPAPVPLPQAPPQPAFSELPSTSPEKTEQARQALEKKMQEVTAAPAQVPEVKPAPPITPAPAPEVKAAAAKPPKAPQQVRIQSDFERIPGPPLPISEDKRARLAELLRRYKADEITPEQYHVERAKILGQ